METQRSSSTINAMAFYHEKGHVPSWKNAAAFAGKTGRVATMPDIVQAKLSAGVNDFPWNTYFTTNSAEYVGFSKGRNKIIIVAHGLGPMSSLDGILAAYKHEYDDKDRRRRGGRISQTAFLQLESGAFGEVAIVDFKNYVRRYEYPFLEHLTAVEGILDPLLRARLGRQHEKYVDYHTRLARRYHRENGIEDVFNPVILQLGGAANCSYMHYEPEQGKAFAHLLSVGALTNTYLSDPDYPRFPVLVCDFSAHEWWNGVRFVGIRDAASLVDIHPGVDLQDALPDNWQLVATNQNLGNVEPQFHVLVDVGGHWFTEYPKIGACLDTGEPKFRVKTSRKIGNPVSFQTSIGGYDGFLKYDIKEVQKLAPRDANAYYLLGCPEIVTDGKRRLHEVKVQFCHVEVDYSQRILRSEELASDLPRILRIAEALKNKQ